jgi:hypothetical protein
VAHSPRALDGLCGAMRCLRVGVVGRVVPGVSGPVSVSGSEVMVCVSKSCEVSSRSCCAAMVSSQSAMFLSQLAVVRKSWLGIRM